MSVDFSINAYKIFMEVFKLTIKDALQIIYNSKTPSKVLALFYFTLVK